MRQICILIPPGICRSRSRALDQRRDRSQVGDLRNSPTLQQGWLKPPIRSRVLKGGQEKVTVQLLHIHSQHRPLILFGAPSKCRRKPETQGEHKTEWSSKRDTVLTFDNSFPPAAFTSFWPSHRPLCASTDAIRSSSKTSSTFSPKSP